MVVVFTLYFDIENAQKSLWKYSDENSVLPSQVEVADIDKNDTTQMNIIIMII